MTYFVDSNIFLRIVAKNDKKKVAECEQFLEAINEGRINACTSSVVIAEIIWVGLRFYKIRKKEIVKLVQALLTTRNLRIRDESNTLTALTLYEKYAVKFIDALIASDPWFKEGKMTIVSYDKDFDALGVERVQPGKAVKRKK